MGRKASRPDPARGFTLIELIFGLAIVSVLVGLGVPTVRKAVLRARVSAARTTIETFATAEAIVISSTGRYTTTLGELKQASIPGGFGSAWGGPYLISTSTTDPWGKPYFYSSWHGGNAPTEWESKSLWEYAATGRPVLDTGPVIRQEGQPLEIEYVFDASQQVYLLTVFDNGISSGWITLNGVSAVDPMEFGQQVETITKEVDLESENILTVQLASGPRNLIRVVIETYAPPALPHEDMAGSELGWYDVFGGSPNAGFLLGSYGADGQPGGTGPGADIIYGVPAAH